LPATLLGKGVPNNQKAMHTQPVRARVNSTPWPAAATIIQRFGLMYALCSELDF
jgi:hypothetical protein